MEHSVHDLVTQRIYGLAPGYEDLNDHDALRSGSTLALLVGKRDITGADRNMWVIFPIRPVVVGVCRGDQP